MAQQPQVTSQVVFGPANTGGDIVHILNNTGALAGYIDKNNAAQGISVAVNGLQVGPAIAITAAVGGVFQTASGQAVVNAPSATLEQVPFVVKASGILTLGAGTYTATVQPLLYASTTAGYTAAAANAIYSAAAASCTVTSASAISVPWSVEAHVIGDSTSGKLTGWTQGMVPTTGATLAVTPAAITVISNIPTGVNFSSAVPLSFAAGVTVGGTAAAGSAYTLGSLIIES